ncbi:MULTISPECIES: TetR family transcriptional regulator [Rhodococcus]|jgi:AcrR family transcriptional regulator|uniref:TetR family transcriptional regulator n=1 Tax=Rhodococcus aetherivorans TaxID=191292 RepID=A0AA46SA17_9NOCA|nr:MULTISPECIES: TetR family transcriptional regulator [Rhodococcus]AKE88164.1 TetR family transcriptional regulator [Rhodococcus aetherivorans]OLL20170.1 TetR family transcriptional regulator [Rhodococcus sp. M8]QPG44018.1 TetR family transcriptional regulator [Rhodococcus sp. M8]QRI76492.1 TetR family transcriptional regulator [Rhodococcus aetherivorans]QSE59904.1 TetR family transcriptional regulator [Rhodococcus sp. PSBB066]
MRTVEDVTNPPGLRDRKKAATRAALVAAAADLARAKGIDGVTADAIAAKAGVSTRTFHNYFASKEEAVLAHLEGLVHSWVGRLHSRPAGEPVWDSMEAVARQIVSEPDGDFVELCSTMELVDQSPALLARRVEMEVRASQLLVEAIAERTGTDPRVDLYPSLVRYAAVSAMKSAVELWLAGTSGAASPEELVRAAFGQLRQGLS